MNIKSLMMLFLTPHRCKIKHFKNIEKKVGNFNAGFVAIKNSKNGNKVLQFWKKKCLDWCFDIPDDSRYADQKYLNDISKKFKNIQTFPSIGLNLAPWNIANKNQTLEISKVYISTYLFFICRD